MSQSTSSVLFLLSQVGTTVHSFTDLKYADMLIKSPFEHQIIVALTRPSR